MGYMIQIGESKADKLKEHAYKSMKHLGKLYDCIEEICEESQMGERDGGYYGNRSGGGYSGGGYSGGGSYGNRYGMREEEDWEQQQHEPWMGQRRGVPGSGRGRYRN